MGDGMLGGCLGHSDHKVIVLNPWRSKEGGQQSCYVGLSEGRLWPAYEHG